MNTPDLLLPPLAQLACPLYKAMDGAAGAADAFCIDQDLTSASARSHIIRAVGRKRFVDSEEVGGWATESGIPNDGFHVRYGPLVIRVVRATWGFDAPAPGRNPARREYYQQDRHLAYQMSLWDTPEMTNLESDNLLGLWRDGIEGMVEIVIARPIGVWSYGKKAKTNLWLPLDRAGNMERTGDARLDDFIVGQEDDERGGETGEL